MTLNAAASRAAKDRGMQLDPFAVKVRDVLRYDESTGLFFWRVPHKRLPVGSRAGCKDREGYWVIQVAGRRCYAHRLAWLHVHGQWPAGVIDHKNGQRADNRITNLRDVSIRVNGQNLRDLTPRSKSGLRGAHPSDGRFRARLGHEGRVLSLGSYDTAEEAHKAYLDAKRQLHEGCTV